MKEITKKEYNSIYLIFFYHLYRYNAIITRPDLKKIHNDDNLRTQILSICESFIGCVQGKIFF